MYEVVSARVRLRSRQEVCLAGPGWGLAGPGGAWRRGLGGAWQCPAGAWWGLVVRGGGLTGPGGARRGLGGADQQAVFPLAYFVQRLEESSE